MKAEDREQLCVILDMLKNTMQNADIGIGVTKNEIIFYDKDTYTNKRQFNGFSIDVRSLNGVKI